MSNTATSLQSVWNCSFPSVVLDLVLIILVVLDVILDLVLIIILDLVLVVLVIIIALLSSAFGCRRFGLAFGQ
eukprot:gene5299-7071_t